MNKSFIRAYCEAENARAGKPGEPIRFVASTPGIKRDGMDLASDRWLLENYQRNPVVLWVHDYFGRNLPIGRASASIEPDALQADIVFDQEDEFARQVESKYRRGYMNAISVGWDVIEREGKKMYDLLDISAVPVPGDPDALMERQFRALKRIYEDPDPSGSGEVGWERAAARMAALFTLLADDPDQERETTYRALLPAYRRQGKTPPDFQTAEELKKLTPELIRGLFYADEPELFPEWFRNGQPMSLRMHARLTQAVTLIQEVLEFTPAEEEPRDPPVNLEDLEAISKRLKSIGGTQ